MWHDEALQAIALAEHLQLGAVSLLGTSGGAWAAVNAALERPDLFRAVVADSFDGRTLHDGFARQLLRERDAAKADEQARAFYAWCQGADWQTVVDLDTVALVQCAAEKRPLFCRPLSDLELPVLFIGSREDEMCRAGPGAGVRRHGLARPRRLGPDVSPGRASGARQQRRGGRGSHLPLHREENRSAQRQRLSLLWSSHPSGPYP